MKHLSTSYTAILLLICASFLISCDDEDENEIKNDNTVFDYFENNPDYSVLTNAIEVAGLRSTLDGRGTFTVFAPNNDALSLFLSSNNLDLNNLTPEERTLLQQVLLYHVLETEVLSSGFSTDYVKTAAVDGAGFPLDLYVDADDLTLNEIPLDANLIDIELDNGIVHALDGTLSLPSIVTLLSLNPDFSNLETALTQENLVTALADEDVLFTVLAPTNAAFTALIDADTNDDLDDINDVLQIADLDEILKFHVISDTSLREDDFTDGLQVNTFADGNSTFTVDASDGAPVITVDGVTLANFEFTNITARNGVIHSIDNLLFAGMEEAN
ncbi:MAG: fasciclin domain-containing protein [Nonlabens sp.]